MSESAVRGARRLGVWDRLGPITRAVFESAPERGRAWVARVLAHDGVRVVLPAHATAPAPGGRQGFADCFDFLLEGVD